MNVPLRGISKLSNYITKKTLSENFQSRVEFGKNTGENPVFYLRFCERWPLARSKEAFERAKGHLLEGWRLPFRGQNGKK